MEILSVKTGQAVFGKNEYTYQCVVDDFKNANFIGIMTFNISPKKDSHLLTALKDACKRGANAIVVTNVPKRFPSYHRPEYAVAAKDKIDLYKRQLDPAKFGMRLTPYFAFNNHAKIIMTENVVYWGSSNFSDESSENFECGTISTDRELIAYMKDSLFPHVQGKSVPYYKYNFAEAIANMESLISACKSAKQGLFEAAFEPWADYNTSFEDKWIYKTTDSGLTVDFLHRFVELFSKFKDALNVIDSIIDEYWEPDELIEPVRTLSSLYEEYKRTYDNFNDTISALFENLENIARYNVADEASRKIADDYSMVAYDEKFDYYAEKAMNEAAEEYENLIQDAEQTVYDALECLDVMIKYLGQLNIKLHQLLEVNAEIDNTNVK